MTIKDHSTKSSFDRMLHGHGFRMTENRTADVRNTVSRLRYIWKLKRTTKRKEPLGSFTYFYRDACIWSNLSGCFYGSITNKQSKTALIISLISIWDPKCELSPTYSAHLYSRPDLPSSGSLAHLPYRPVLNHKGHLYVLTSIGPELHINNNFNKVITSVVFTVTAGLQSSVLI